MTTNPKRNPKSATSSSAATAPATRSLRTFPTSSSCTGPCARPRRRSRTRWCFTIPASARWRGQIRGRSGGRTPTAIFGLATGYGLDDNILNSYEFIVDNYTEGDDIYLFGFSRGAYTVRALAGLIHKIGLIAKPQGNLAGSGLTAYKQFCIGFRRPAGGLDLKRFTDGGAAGRHAVAGRTRRRNMPASCQREMADHQVRRGLGHRGQRDRAAAGPALLAEPADAGLRAAQSLRSKSSARRSRSTSGAGMFRLQPWAEGGKFWPNRYAPKDKWKDQDSLQVWFAGVHSDIGGGYPETGERAVEIPAAVDDRGGGEMPGSRSTAAPSTSSAGAASARTARSITSRRASCPTLTIRPPPPGSRTIR